jgi:hypothetical protein
MVDGMRSGRGMLQTRSHPQAVFQGTASPEGTGFRVEGELELAGGLAPLAFTAASGEGGYAARFEASAGSA